MLSRFPPSMCWGGGGRVVRVDRDRDVRWVGLREGFPSMLLMFLGEVGGTCWS